MSFNHLTHRELHSHIYRKTERMLRCSWTYPNRQGILFRNFSSLSLTDTSPVGSLPTCILPIHSLFHILPLHYLSKMYKRNLKMWFYLKKNHIHLNWAAYCPLTFYPQSIFSPPFWIACQIPYIYTTILLNYSLVPDNNWFMTSYYPTFSLSASRLKAPTGQKTYPFQ